MADSLRHRGPDDEGFYSDDVAGLAFRRLAIVDLAGGHQPQHNEDARVHVIFNGEIYNHRELRKELVEAGHKFLTDHSDTEVFVHGWEQWRYDLFPRLNGIFAVAIWDSGSSTLVLGRDRHGVKPVHYSELADGSLVFGSEIRAIHASGCVPKAPSHTGILEYFSFQNLWGESTMFEGIRQLEAGHTLTWKSGKTELREFWDFNFPRRRREDLATLAGEHREILSRALARQIQADVPVMSYLSGGIDSTAITVGASRLDQRVTAYSVIFNLEGVGEDRQLDEREFSRLVASEYGLKRVEMELPQDTLSGCLDSYVDALEEPRMGMGYPVYLVAGRVAKDAKVVLSGTGGDELHGGYVGRYQVLGLTGEPLPPPPRISFRGRVRGLLRGQRAVPRTTENLYRGMLNFLVQRGEQRDVFTPEFLRNAGGFDPFEKIDRYVADCPSEDWRDRVMYVDAKTYLVGLLVLEDKLSMAHGLETRVPLLDNELVDFLLDVPFEALCRGGVGKILFRESVKPWVPEQIHTKPKMGFGPPDASWYRGVLRSWLEKRLAPNLVKKRGVISPAFVAKTLDDHLTGRRNNAYLLWAFLNFDAWCDDHGFFS